MKRIFLFLILTGCTGSLVTNPLPELSADTCNANQYSALIGQEVTDLEKVLILGPVRLIRPNTAVTMDYLEQRINFEITKDEKIARITCG